MREMSVVRWHNGVEMVEYRSGMRWDRIVVVWRGESKRIARNNDVSYTEDMRTYQQDYIHLQAHLLQRIGPCA
jgi:hypothetical protein